MKSIPLIALIILAASLTLTSCGDKEERTGKKMEKGFRLPTGDSKDGEIAFVELSCHACHSVEGVELPQAKNLPKGTHFPLGGEVRKVKTYGQLVTAIIQPQHVISKDYLATLEKDQRDNKLSPMINSNATMTVQQLADLVAFLHARYKKTSPNYDVYLEPPL